MCIYPLKIANLPCFKILWINPIEPQKSSMKFPQPTLSETHSWQPSHRRGKLGDKVPIPRFSLFPCIPLHEDFRLNCNFQANETNNSNIFGSINAHNNDKCCFDSTIFCKNPISFASTSTLPKLLQCRVTLRTNEFTIFCVFTIYCKYYKI